MLVVGLIFNGELEGLEPSTFPMASGRTRVSGGFREHMRKTLCCGNRKAADPSAACHRGTMVELEGFEPSTSSMPLKRSPN